MILALDIGNSRIKAGIQRGGGVDCFTTPTRPLQDARAYIKGLGITEAFDGVIISSVVNELDKTFQEISHMLCGREAMIVHHAINTGIKFLVENPEAIGSDRIANAVGGYHIARGPAIVVDLGSATTFTVVSSDAEFLGGCIMPGIEMMASALCEKTSKLPPVDFQMPKYVTGRNTVESIRSGLSYGVAGAIERLCAEIQREIGYTMKVILTGGMYGTFRNLITHIDIIEPLLTLKGLFRIYEMNKGDSSPSTLDAANHYKEV